MTGKSKAKGILIKILHGVVLTASVGQSCHRSIFNIPITIDSDLGDFRLVRKIGEGGMGIVFEAIQKSLNRTVAVKLLRDHIALNDRSRIRFENEAIAAARLKNQNIVPVYSIGRQGDTLNTVRHVSCVPKVAWFLEQRPANKIG